MFKLFKRFSAPRTSTVRIDNDQVTVDQVRGNALLAEAKFDEAALCYRQVVACRPDRIAGYLSLGYALTQLNQLEQAEQVLQQAIAIDSNNIDALYMLATIERDCGRPETAIKHLHQLLVLQPTFELAYCDLCSLLIGVNRYDEANAVIQAGLVLFPQAGRFHFLVGVLQARASEHQQAERSFTCALSGQPDAPDIHFHRATNLDMLGQLDDAVESFSHAIRLKPDFANAHRSLGDTLLKLNQHDSAVRSYQRSLDLEPDNISALVNQSASLHYLKRYQESLAACDRALMLMPATFATLMNRGAAFFGLEQYAKALESYDQAALLEPESCDLLTNRGNVLSKLNRHQEALECYNRSLERRPDYINTLLGRGAALLELHQHQAALDCWAWITRLEPELADAHYNESLCRLRIGDYAIGWVKHEWRWRTASFKNNRLRLSQPLWLGQENLEGKTILLYPEQGLGDCIQFCRYASEVAKRGATVILLVPPSLASLMTSVLGVSRIVIIGEPLPDFDLHCPLMSLPLALCTRVDTIVATVPYMHVSADMTQKWGGKLGPQTRPRIGLVWSGNSAHTNDHNRSIPLAEISSLLSDQAQFISLQKELRSSDLETLREHNAIRHFGDELESFEDTAGLIQNMDLVISVDTSIAHLAGALGKKVWILLPTSSDWRWMLERSDSPWYPTARLFRQSPQMDKGQLIKQVARQLKEFLVRFS